MDVEVDNLGNACDGYQVTVTNAGAVPTTVPPRDGEGCAAGRVEGAGVQRALTEVQPMLEVLWCRESACTEPHTLIPNAFIDCLDRVELHCLCVPVICKW